MKTSNAVIEERVADASSFSGAEIQSQSQQQPLTTPNPNGDASSSPGNARRTVLDWALYYAHRGWPVFPLAPRRKTPLIPKEEGGRGFHDATTDEMQIRRWWTEHPDANVGIATGKVSGIVAVDVDGAEGEARLREILGGELPATLINDTRPGRYQLIFTYPEGGFPSNAGELGEHLDLRGDLGYITAPPSIHPETGTRYNWRNAKAQPLSVPSALLAAVYSLEAPTRKKSGFTVSETIPEGMRDETLFRLACSLRQAGFTRDEISETLHAVNTKRCKPPLDETQVEAKIESAMRYPVSRTETPDLTIPAWPEAPAPVAYHGLAGDIVRAIEPHSEADPIALLVQLIVAFGNAVGRGPHFQVEADEHHLNLFTLLVGPTSKGRKGTAWSHVRALLQQADPSWASNTSGLSSGEGLIWAVRDPVKKQEPIKDKSGRVTDYQMVVTDPGVDDKRLLVIETEFASVLNVIGREGNTLSPLVRQAWDTGCLRSLTKNSPAQATDAHISINAHVTASELRTKLKRVELGNGFMNRFLIICVRRSKFFPDGGHMDQVDTGPLVARLGAALTFARGVAGLSDLEPGVTAMPRDEEARGLWHEVYAELSEGLPGLLGAVTSRAEAQVVRLSCIYALLGESREVKRVHLEAALALWAYAAASARYVFGETLGDPVADRVLTHLRQCLPEGETRTGLQELFDGHKSAELSAALSSLVEQHLAYCAKEPTGGRPEERWFATEAKKASPEDADSYEEQTRTERQEEHMP